jgi:hypothetical protein
MKEVEDLPECKTGKGVEWQLYHSKGATVTIPLPETTNLWIRSMSRRCTMHPPLPLHRYPAERQSATTRRTPTRNGRAKPPFAGDEPSTVCELLHNGF